MKQTNYTIEERNTLIKALAILRNKLLENPNNKPEKIIRELAYNSLHQVIQGNGDKHLFITSDDEANEYHALYYLIDGEPSEIDYYRAEMYCFDGFKDEEIALLG